MSVHFQTLVIVIFAAFIVCVQSLVRVDLSGDGWTVKNSATGQSVPGRVPGSMYTALLDHGVITDPLYRDNDVKFAWIGLANWTYSRTFSVSDEISKAKQTWLVCDGLDTIATVVVNGQVVGQSDNMFVKAAFNVTGIVKTGNNTLAVNFNSAVSEALARVKNSAYDVPPDCPTAVQNGQCHINQIRKEQCSFSWDWGPSFPTQGIWKPIYIDAYNSAVIQDISAVVQKVNLQWVVLVDVFFAVDVAREVQGQLNATLADLKVASSQQVTISPSNNSIRLVLPIPTTTNVPLWWPNGYGDQPLFNLAVSFNSGSDISQKSIRIGFRTVELVQDPVSNRTQDGLTFYFRINGNPIFLKGSNWIPADSFQERITKGELKFLLGSAANVSINSLRVWGGGVYESDEFYDICDELGILIWQDMMFSVAMYPVYQEFLDSVATEIRHQIRRLKHRPSILCWAGSNENEAALRQNWFGTSRNYSLYYNDYVELYVKVIKVIVQSEDPTRDYLTSSPSNGKESEQEGYVAKNPASEFYGDIHYYDYSVDQWNASSFEIPRMASEYGVQAWCNNESLADVFAAEDFSMSSAMVNHRQHHPGGNVQMAAEVGLHLHLPDSSDPKSQFVDFIYLTQINQAMSIRTQSEHYRRSQSQLRSDGRGLTMGALYWQLNDIWQAPTWASIDYESRWKMLHYYARSFFSKYLVSPYLRPDNTLDIFFVVDGVPVTEARTADGKLFFHPITSLDKLLKRGFSTDQVFEVAADVLRSSTGNVTVSIYDYSSFNILHSWNTPFSIKLTAESVFTKSIADLLSESKCQAVENCLLSVTATDNAGSVLSTSWLALAYPKYSKLLPANVKVTAVTQVDQYSFNIQVSTDAIALFVWLATDNIQGHFSDNGFVMLTPDTTVKFYALEQVTADQISAQIRVRSVTDVKY
ncbi:hypothetical protein BsWGS_25381 [Bradybaena similaris]